VIVHAFPPQAERQDVKRRTNDLASMVGLERALRQRSRATNDRG
jgi:hypothetical protein